MRYRDVVIGLWAASVASPISAYLRVIDPRKSIERIQGLPSPSGVDQSSRLVWFSLVFNALPAELQLLAGRSPVLQFGPFRARLQDFFKLQTAMNDKGR